MIKVSCLGAAGCVTGSNYLLELNHDQKIMIDCGMFQGGRQIEERNYKNWSFDPKQVHTLLVTHAHIDHIGRIPKLVKDGFRGKILTTSPTVELSRIMLLDSAHIQEMDAEWQNRKIKRKNHKGLVTPLYTTQDAQKSFSLFSAVERDTKISVCPGIWARFRNAGHILGSSIIEVWVEDGDEKVKIVFSGDIGKNNQLIVKDPEVIRDADYVFIESTYGNRLHRSFEESKAEFVEAIEYAFSNREKVIIPAFAVERTQEILYILGEYHRKGLLPNIPIYLDSPLAIGATEIFRKNQRFYDDAALEIVKNGNDPFDMPNLRFTETTRESEAINHIDGPAIIIAGSGMCTAGRIKHHLKHNLWRKGSSVIIVGYQASGTTGRMIVDGKKWVKIFWQNVAVRARVFSVGGFSAHADQDGLLEWLANFTQARPRVFVMHGEPSVSEQFAALVKERLGFKAYVPRWKERLILSPKDVSMELFAEEDAEETISQNMLKAIGELEAELQQLKSRIADADAETKLTEEDVDRLKFIQEEMQIVINTPEYADSAGSA